MYQKPFFLHGLIGNNAFSFKKRHAPQLYVPRVIEGDLTDVQISDQIAFEDIDENGIFQTCPGLKYFVKLKHPETDTPVIIVDNHNHVFYFWYEAWHQNLIERGITLVHIDAHRDSRIPKRNLSMEEAEDPEAVFNYTNQILNVGNYIPPALNEGLIENLISITSEDELENAKPKAPFILNIDLDFWAPDMNYIDQDWSLEKTRNLMREADLITIATSPFFIEPERALQVLHKLMATYPRK